MTRQHYRCHECDDWKSGLICPDCGGPCAIYRPSSPARSTGYIDPDSGQYVGPAPVNRHYDPAD